MKTIRLVLLLSIILFQSANSLAGQKVVRDSLTVTFVLRSESLPEDSSVYITGNLDELGSWNPGRIKMDYSGKNEWTRKIYLNEPVSIEYKYTLGTWDREGAAPDGNPLSNSDAYISESTVIVDHINYWTNPGPRKIFGQITGNVKYHQAMEGEGIKPRDIIVWLPPDYDKDTLTRYSVLYMHDGQNIVDPATSAFGVDWQMDESADSLIKANKIPPVIIVGIYNTPDRSNEYLPGEKGSLYMNFVANHLKPFIDSEYRTRPQKEYTFTGGSSAAGAISFMLVWEFPEVFSGAICMSPAFKIGDVDYVEKVKSYLWERKEIRVFIYNGGVGLETRLQPGIDEMIESLKMKGYKYGEDIMFIKDPEAQHFETAWAKYIPDALQFILKGVN